MVFTASYYQGKVLEWIQPYIMKYMETGWIKKLFQDTQNILNPVTFIVQLKTIFEELDPKQEAEGKLL